MTNEPLATLEAVLNIDVLTAYAEKFGHDYVHAKTADLRTILDALANRETNDD